MMIDFENKKLPEELVQCVQDSIESIVDSIFGNKPSFKPEDENKKIGDGVVGIISFMGDVNWMMMLALPKTSAEKIAFKFTGFEVKYDEPDMGDVVGELNNVLAGDIVARLSSVGVKVGMSLPTTMRGHDVEPLLPKGCPAMKMAFSMDEGDFYVKLAANRSGETIGRKPGT